MAEISAINVLRNLHKEFTRCSICFDVYRQPKMLPCLHSFCFQCLEDFRVRSSPQPIVCPLCRSDAPQTTQGLEALPANFLITRLIELKLATGEGDTDESRFGPCDPCSEGATTGDKDDEVAPSKAEMFCVECNEKLCESCIAAHRKMKLSKGHQLVLLGSENVGQLDQLMKNRAVNCEVHPDERIDFFCLTCSSTVCMKCCMLQHKTHDYKDIAEVSTMFKAGLSSIIESVSTYITKFQASSEELGKQRQRLEGKKKHLEVVVENRFSKLLAEIEQQKAAILVAMNEYEEEKTEEINDLSEDIQVRLDTLESYREFCQQLREKGTNYEITKLSNQFLGRFQALQDMSSSTESDAVKIALSFKSGPEGASLTQNAGLLFGELVTKSKEPVDAKIQPKPKKKLLKKVPPPATMPPYGVGTTGQPPKGARARSGKGGPGKYQKPVDPKLGFHRNLSSESADSMKEGHLFKTWDSGDLAESKNAKTVNPLFPVTLNPQFSAALLSVVPGNKPIQGIAVLGYKLLVARSATPYLEVFDISNDVFNADGRKQQHIPGLANAFDLAADEINDTVYVSESMKNCVYRLAFKKNGTCQVCPFTTNGKPFGLSVNYAHNVLIACPQEYQILEYSRNGDIVRTISTMMHSPRHIIELSHNQFILLSGDRDMHYTVSRLSVDANGKADFQKQYGGEKTPAKYRLNEPTHLALDTLYNVVLIADCLNHRVTAFRADNLYSCKNVVGEKQVTKPSRICFDPFGSLFVGSIDGQIQRFSLTRSIGSVDGDKC